MFFNFLKNLRFLVHPLLGPFIFLQNSITFTLLNLHHSVMAENELFNVVGIDLDLAVVSLEYLDRCIYYVLYNLYPKS